MFRRTKSETAQTTTAQAQIALRDGGKGRPTPSRKEAQAAAKARAKVPRTRKEIAAAQKSTRSDGRAKARAGMRDGDERYLMARDKGPLRRFIRDFVDVRFSFVGLVIPLLVVTMVMGYSGNARLASFGNTLLFGSILLVMLDMGMLRFRLRRELAARFPDAPLKGTTYYALTRAMQMKFMRLPKSKLKIGQQLPDQYR